MPSRNAGFEWLLIGGVAALVVPLSGIDAIVAGWADAVLPFAAAKLFGGLLVFFLATAFHFRYHWVRSLEELGAARQRMGAAARRIDEARLDGLRWLRVIQENLELVVDTDQRPADAELYLGGARAHAEKLEQAFVRIDGIVRRLDGGRSRLEAAGATADDERSG